MKTENSRLPFFLGLLCLCLAAPVGGKGLDILICYPGGSVRAQDAKPALDSMISVLESIGGWPQGTIHTQFTARTKQCQQLLNKKPHFAILSLGLFLQNREALQLVPLVQPRIEGSTTDTFRVLTRKDAAKNLAELKGKSLGGPWLSEPEFLARMVFDGQIDPASHFQLKPSRRALRALRKLAQGKLDAVLVNQMQYDGLALLPFAAKLSVAFTSQALPQIGVVANQQRTSAEDRRRLLQAISTMCTHEQGKKLCELFSIETFVPVDEKVYEAVIQRWKQVQKM